MEDRGKCHSIIRSDPGLLYRGNIGTSKFMLGLESVAAYALR